MVAAYYLLASWPLGDGAVVPSCHLAGGTLVVEDSSFVVVAFVEC